MDDATYSAEKAIAYDNAGRYDAAIYFYVDAANTILNLIRQNKVPASFRASAEGYISRAEYLKVQRTSMVCKNIKDEHQNNLERSEFLLYQALDADQAGNASDAITLYSEAIQLCLKSAATCGPEMQKKLRDLAKRALDRAEILKGHSSKEQSTEHIGLPEVPTDELSHLKLDDRSGKGSRSAGSTPTKVSKVITTDGEDDGRLGKDELAVLAVTSNINSRQYVPFLAVDLKERFAYPVPFTDHHGLLVLAAKQKQRLSKWLRPNEIMQSPTIIQNIDSGTIKQTIVSDCSFIASLSISARYEKRFGKRLVTSIIFPQNKRGEPIYNPCGKYMIKLHINGVWRKVFVTSIIRIDKVIAEFLIDVTCKRSFLAL
ncbi:unnamed protein product [Anisakis simplex]|uniref:Calpain-7 (inferred by orthology to a human protein) n=1 Tax=Anisakis simplex TaxID=6269 RepID=A0A0M3K123_ANISI|nr:unnamed protein product [Anisakis simplex]